MFMSLFEVALGGQGATGDVLTSISGLLGYRLACIKSQLLLSI
jgi:hypothetical protein